MALKQYNRLALSTSFAISHTKMCSIWNCTIFLWNFVAKLSRHPLYFSCIGGASLAKRKQSENCCFLPGKQEVRLVDSDFKNRVIL